MIFPFFDHLPTPKWTFITLNMDQNWHFLTTYPPHLVHVVFEQPQGKIPFISNLKKPGCGSKWDILELATLGSPAYGENKENTKL